MAATNRSQTSIDLSKSLLSLRSSTMQHERHSKVLTNHISDTILYNVDGAMGCCDQMGNKTWKGPQVG